MLSELSASPRLDNAIPSWHSIDWKKCHRAVRKLQARIAKAVKESEPPASVHELLGERDIDWLVDSLRIPGATHAKVLQHIQCTQPHPN